MLLDLSSTSMLTLNSTTLLFWNLNNQPKKPKHNHNAVRKWAHSIPLNAKADRPTSDTGHSITPTLTNQTTMSGSSSVHTAYSQAQTHALHIVIKPEPQYDGLVFAQDDVIISDQDERTGTEHKEVVKSPPKGSSVRLGSKVHFWLNGYNLLTPIHVVASCRYQME